MIIDLRYHIASLVAVFLALGLGILVGGIFLKSDILVNRQKELTDRLEVQIEQLRQKNETVEKELSSLVPGIAKVLAGKPRFLILSRPGARPSG